MDKHTILRRLLWGFLTVIVTLLITACPDNGDRIADCDPGWHPCENDPAECCMDTTSHNFIFEIDTLGNSGFLYDIFALSPDNVWAVGDIVTDSGSFNAAKWDGQSWSIFNIEALYNSNLLSPSLRSIWVFDSNNIWVLGSYPIQWDGENGTFYHLTDMGIIPGGLQGKIWASDENNVYFVGRSGRIVRYSGSFFEKMESGTDQDIDVITGYYNEEKGQINSWVGGWADYPHRGFLLEYDGNNWQKIWDETSPFYDDPEYIEPTIWYSGDRYLIIYASGYGQYGESIIVHHNINDIGDYQIIGSNSDGFIRDISGNNSNDYFLVGDFDNVLHYNGSSFRHYSELELEDSYSAVAQYQNYVFICHTYLPIVIRGIRIP